MGQTVGMTRPSSVLFALGVVTLACAPREAPTTSPTTDDDAQPPSVRTEFVAEVEDDSIPNATETTDDARPKPKPDAPKSDAPTPPPEQESTAPSPDGTQPEAGAPPPTVSKG